MAIQQVHVIIPKEVIDAMINNQENQSLETIVPTEIQNLNLNATEGINENSTEDINENDTDVINEVEEQTKVINEIEGVQPQVATSTRGDKKFTKLREKMVADALGVSINEMKTFISDYQSSLDGNSHMNDSREDRLRRARGIFTVQRGANNNDKKDTFRGAVSSIGSLIIGTTMLADIITLPVKAAICLISVGYNIYRYNKRKQGNRFDEYAKQEDYEKQLSIFFEDAKRLDEEILKDRETLEKYKKTMSRREYKAFRQEYLKNKVSELQIESPFVRDKLVQSGLQQMPNRINNVLNLNKTAEVIA